ncbi:hypothetical protein K0504_17030 [Neiella marina]|uniref:Uncharacterized protein n=1 Tax=Neiella holothuriorum TaxID=2870530 RepID=A0ABS7EK60_9GAMM|nr:hypothetical protein [Neiella holothuriorum]MBW8192744.1 hypothetical protein [Neiella holothuriorum]
MRTQYQTMVSERPPEYFSEWVWFANNLLNIDTSHDNALRAIIRAEQLAKNSWDWRVCAGFYANKLSNWESCRSSLNNAMVHSINTCQLICCAHDWLKLLDDKHCAVKCMTEAESLATSTMEWLAITRFYHSTQFSQDKVVYCLGMAASLTVTADDNVDVELARIDYL